jgi:streptomycin 6-kinase
LNLPPEFISTIHSTYGHDGKKFLAALPKSISEASARWGLTDIRPVPNLSYNFVAFANRAPATGRRTHLSTQREVVLKMGVPNGEFRSEMAALRLFDGNGACRLIDYEEEKYWMLLERLQPGAMLSTREDDEEATQIAAEVMQKIWRPMEHVILSPSASVSTSSTQRLRINSAKDLDDSDERLFGRGERSLKVTYDSFIQLSDWFGGLKKLRARFNGGTGPLNEKLVERVEGAVKDFFAENQNPMLMHGDFHHFNILSSERGWLIIDPKGVIGPACYEVGPLLMNPWGDLLSGKDYRGLTKRRIDILHERLGFERQRIREWGLAHAILSAWWGIEDNTGWEYSLAFAEMIAALDLN